MARYIDAEALKKMFVDGVRVHKGMCSVMNVIHNINNAPTADVEEVVRCSECKYQDDCLQKVDCDYQNREIVYCSYGERRTDDDVQRLYSRKSM